LECTREAISEEITASIYKTKTKSKMVAALDKLGFRWISEGRIELGLEELNAAGMQKE
jgi:hypothetical protein